MKWLYPVAMLVLCGWLAYLKQSENAALVFFTSLAVAWAMA